MSSFTVERAALHCARTGRRPRHLFARVKRRTLFTSMAAATVVAVFPASASALVNSSPDYWKETAERRAVVERLVYSQTPQAIPASYDAVREAEEILRQQQRTLPASNPKVPQLWGQMRTITVRSGLTAPLRALGWIGLGVTAFDLGWKIGTGLNAKLLKIGIPSRGLVNTLIADEAPEISFRAAGQRSQLWYQIPAPEDAWVYSVWSGAFGRQRSYEFRGPNTDPDPYCRGQAVAGPAGFRAVQQANGGCSNAGLRSYYTPENALGAAAAVEPYTDQPYQRSTPAPAPPPQTTVKEAVSAELDKSENAVLRDWLNYMLGSPGQQDPTGIGEANPEIVTLPACRGMTFEACSQTVRDLGLTGTISQHTLSSYEAIMEDDADRVTAIHPDGQVQSTDDISVYVNPAAMPTMTAQQTVIADALETNNPEQVNASNKKTLARQCERFTTTTGSQRTASDCVSPELPIYVIGREWPEAADHTVRGLDYHPAWTLLTYEDVVRTSWYYGYPETDGGAASCRGSGVSTACDEWPWQSTEQGGLSGFPLPHLKIIDWRQNSISGARYGGFLTTCRLAERKALPTPLNGGGKFLVIPVSKGAPSSMPSMSLCNGTNP